MEVAKHPRTIAKTFGKRIRSLREDKGISLRKFALSVDMSPTYLSKIERGEFLPPSRKLIKAIAKVLEQDEDALLSLAGRIPEDVVQIVMKKNQLATVVREMQNLSEEVINMYLEDIKKRRESESR